MVQGLSTQHSALSTQHPALSTQHSALRTPHPAPRTKKAGMPKVLTLGHAVPLSRSLVGLNRKNRESAGAREEGGQVVEEILAVGQPVAVEIGVVTEEVGEEIKEILAVGLARAVPVAGAAD